MDRSVDREFDYLIPEGLQSTVQIGSRVRLPFRDRQGALGTVVDLLEASPVAFEKLRPLIEVIGEEPAVSSILIQLARWMADYYCCPVEVAMRSVLPQVIRAAEVGKKTRSMVVLKKLPAEAAAAALKKRAPKQSEVLEFLMSIAQESSANHLPIPVSEVLAQCNVTHAVLNAMVKAGFIELTKEDVHRDPYGSETFVPSAAQTLTQEQSVVMQEIKVAMESCPPSERRPLLLHGVTGSGKTEVYLQAIELALAKGKSALVLVPEISLTPQTVERFKSRFHQSHQEVAVLHSHLSDGERFDEWHKINRGNAKIVIGARSAVFAPLKELGLIVVDEEHETSYKQEEAPRYHGRDIAVLRGKLELDCTVILGSATPSLESFHNTQIGKYQLLKMPTRVDDRKLPRIRIIDLRKEAQRRKSSSTAPIVLSEKLRAAIEERLEKKEQTILFLNRRGFATSLQCPMCGSVQQCVACSVTLTVHRGMERLVCHLCGYQAKLPKACPECHDPAIRQAGLGTERVEAVVSKVFPNAKVKRMDADAMSRKEAYRETLTAFRTGKIDILVGTQMIAKGLHFPNVTLVGIINADLGLHLPDFRAGERTFSLLTQVAGRAGRGDNEGEVFVQSFTPFSPSIQFARHHDFEGFWEQESEFRRQCNFAPFTHLALITVRSEHQERAKFCTETLARRLKEVVPPDTTLSEPAPAPLERLKGFYRFQILLRNRSSLKLSRAIKATLEKLTLPSDVFVAVDIDPYQLM